MPADIAGNEQHQYLIARGAREDIWHRLGTYVGDRNLTLVEAHFESKIAEMVCQKSDVFSVYVDPQTGARSVVALPGQKQILRSPISTDDQIRAFGNAVSSDYTILNPQDYERILEPLAKRWNLSVCGALGIGDTLWWCFDRGEVELPGFKHETMRRYVTIVDYRNGRRKAQGINSETRAVCRNTLIASAANAAALFELPHFATFERDVEWVVDFFQMAEDAGERTIAIYAALARKRVTVEEAKEIIAAAYVEPKKPDKMAQIESIYTPAQIKELEPAALRLVEAREKGQQLTPDDLGKNRIAGKIAEYIALRERWEAQRKKVETRREGAWACFEGEGDSEIAGSAYAAVGAVAEDLQHGMPTKRTNLVTVAQDSAFGPKLHIQGRALRKACALVGVGAGAGDDDGDIDLGDE